MKAIVIGAGIIGTLTAYYLAKKGINVTVFERNDKCGAEASDANASQLSFTYLNPIASKQNFNKFVKNFCQDNDRNHSSIDLKDPEFYKFAIRYLNNMRFKNYSFSRERLIRTSLKSRQKFEELIAEENIEFDYKQNGKMQLFYDKESFMQAKFFAKKLIKEHDIPMQGFPKSKAIEIEPALNKFQDNFLGTIFSPIDGVGDCRKFTEELSNILKTKFDNVRFVHENVINFIKDGNKVKAIQTRGNQYEADKFIITGGAYSNEILKKISLKAPIYPCRGYTIITDNNIGLKTNITDSKRKIVYAPIGDKLKISGLMDFKGLNAEIDPDRLNLLKSLAKSGFKDLNLENIEVKSGLRPIVADSIPIVGKYELDNLYLNTGHGMLGWTLSFGTAFNLAEIIS